MKKSKAGEKKGEGMEKTLQGGQLAGGNPARGRVEDDFYATPPQATEALLGVEEIIYPALEPACGAGHISKLLDEDKTTSFDLVYRGYGSGGVDFLTHQLKSEWNTIHNANQN